SGFEEERAAYTAEHPEAPESGAQTRGPEAEAKEAATDEAAALQDDIAELQSKAAERDEYLALAQRAQADFENYRKRAAKAVAEVYQRGYRQNGTVLRPARVVVAE